MANNIFKQAITGNEMGNSFLKQVFFRYGVILLIAAVILFWLWPLRTVPTGSRGVVTVGGSIKSIQSEGFMILAPWEKLNIFNIRSEEAAVENADGRTSDTPPVHVSLTVRYSIKPDKVAEVFEKYSRDGDLQSYVQTATQEVFKAVTARYTAPDLIGKRSLVSADILDALRKKLDVYGAQVINVDMRNFSFSQDYIQIISAKVTQEQLSLGAENKLKTVESEQKQKVAIAEAEATALKAQADGEAYQILKLATAQADALKVQNAALAQNKEVLELRRIEVEQTKASKWNGQLPSSVYASAPIPFFNVPSNVVK